MFKIISYKWMKVLHLRYISFSIHAAMARCAKSIISTLKKSVFLHLRLNCAIRDEQHQKSLSSAIDKKDECVKLELPIFGRR